MARTDSAEPRSSCPICDSLKVNRIAVLGERGILRCQTCRFEFVDPFLWSDQFTASAITQPEYIEAMRTQYEVASSWVGKLADRRLEYYARVLGRKAGRILEVGAGMGWMVKAYRERGIDAVGMEIDADLVRSASKLLGVSLISADICKFDIDSLGTFDIICSSQTLEHIFTPQSALTNMVAAVSVGGLVHIDVPNAASWGSRVRRVRHGKHNWGVIELPHHQVGYYPATIGRLFRHSGLDIVEVSERPTDHDVFGQTILPTTLSSRVAIFASRILGHGYLLVAVGRKTGRDSHVAEPALNVP